MYKVEDITFNTRDEYTRINIAKNIYHSISSDEFYSPCLLDGQWGSGKTEFCHKLHNYIIEQNSANASKEEFKLVPIYINVFNAERINNPFLSLMGGLVGSACNGIVVPTPLIETASNILSTEIALKPIGIGIAKDVAGLLLSKIKEYAPQTTDAVIKQITDGFNNEFSNGLFENAFEEVNKLDKKYHNFSTELQNFATEKTPIIFIIDELDRCRPNFAIQFLECIKHFFNVDNAYFLLSCNVDQLIASINHLYGERIDGENYLEKFFEDKVVLKNNIINREANIKILSSLNKSSALYPFNNDIVDFIFSSNTLRQQQKILNKHQQIQLNVVNNTKIENTLKNHLNNKVNDFIFAIAYLIMNHQDKDISLNVLLESEIFNILIQSYCKADTGLGLMSIQPHILDTTKQVWVQRLKNIEGSIKQLIASVTYN